MVEEKKLFKIISGNLKNGVQVFDYTKELNESSKLFHLLQNRDDSYWTHRGYVAEEVKESLKAMDDLSIKQVYGVLIAHLKKCNPNEFHTILSWLEKISFRYNTISGVDAKEQEKVYNDIAKNITAGNLINPKDFIKPLKKLYINKEQFINNFINAEIKKTPVIRYIFSKINYFQTKVPLSDNITVEHILAKNQNDDWKLFENPEDNVWKIGNMSLIDKGTNGDMKNKTFSLKKEIYEKSEIGIVKDIVKYVKQGQWTEQSIKERQTYLADIAEKIWSIPEFE